MDQDLLDQVPNRERVLVFLIDKNVAPGNGRLAEVINQHLLLERQLLEAVGVELHHGRVVDALEQVLSLAFRSPGLQQRKTSGQTDNVKTSHPHSPHSIVVQASRLPEED